MKRKAKCLSITGSALCAAALIAAYCTDPDFNNPFDSKSDNYAPYMLTTIVAPEGGGAISRDPNRTYYAAGTSVSVTAVEANGYRFAGWTGASMSANNTMTVTMNGNLTLTANFVLTCTLTTNADPAAGGTVSRGPDQTIFDAETQVTLTAMPNSGYEFVEWTAASGALPPGVNAMDSSITFYINGNVELTAVFQEKTEVFLGGKRWMTRNLDVETDSSWCYNDDTVYCNTYGRLYAWNAAKSACAALGNGWSLPTDADWIELITEAGENGGTKLKSPDYWQAASVVPKGTNDYGFSALPGGCRHETQSYFATVGFYGYWWSATENDDNADNANVFFMAYTYGDNVTQFHDPHYVNYSHDDKRAGFSVRCVRQ